MRAIAKRSRRLRRSRGQAQQGAQNANQEQEGFLSFGGPAFKAYGGSAAAENAGLAWFSCWDSSLGGALIIAPAAAHRRDPGRGDGWHSFLGFGAVYQLEPDLSSHDGRCGDVSHEGERLQKEL